MNVNGPHIDAAISQIGARLKRIRTQRNVTLTALSESTGISKSTLSRLEAGSVARAWSCCFRSRLPTKCRWTNWWRHRRSPIHASRVRLEASVGERYCR